LHTNTLRWSHAGRRRTALVAAVTGLVALAGQAFAGSGATTRSGAPAFQVPPLPAATFQTTSRSVMIPMDDGIRLGATITFPSRDGSTPAAGRFPAVLSMTPYGRNGLCGCTDQRLYSSRGIVSVVVDVRGTGGSEGDLSGNYFSPREQRDGYQLVEWLGTRSWSSGKVGMIGGSYLGITQYLTAEQRPPHLAAIAPQVALSDLYRDAYTFDGIPDIFFDGQYIAVQGAPGVAGSNVGVGLNGQQRDTAPSNLLASLLSTADAKQQQAAGRPIALDYVERPLDDVWYHDRSPVYRASAIRVPTLIMDGWRDGAFVRGALEMYRLLARRQGVETRLVVTACTHKGCGAPFDPTHASGGDELQAIEFDFMSHYLRGTRQTPSAPVATVVQPLGTYQTSSTWPPTGTRFTRFYLHAASSAVPGVAGALSTSRPGTTGSGSYVTDPAAGLSMALNSYGTIAASPYVPLDQRAEELQGLTWRTTPNARPMQIAGPLQLHLSAASTATETDWVARLSDVAPDGSETVITEGALRASHRALDVRRSTIGSPYHLDRPASALTPGQVYAFDIAIIATAYRLAPGHSLQLRLTTDDLPTRLPGSMLVDSTDPTRTQFQPLPPAVNTVEQNAKNPSWLLVPLLPAR
jgi:putative CocE/NonD family hydrolase